MEEEVAVKIMENNGSSEEDRVKFLQEAAIMGQFHHPNIIKILGVVIEKPVSVRMNCKSGDNWNIAMCHRYHYFSVK